MHIAFINDQFIAEDKAVIGIKDLAIRRGYGIFDFFRTVGLKPLFINEHLKRFHSSVEKMGLKLDHSPEELKNICIELVQQNKLFDSGVRIILTGGYSSDGYTPETPNLIITNEPVKMVDNQKVKEGVKLITHDFQREFADIKTINYFTGIMLQPQVKKAGAYDVLYHDHGQVRECTRSNIFIVTEADKIATPNERLLLGVTRRKVIDIAREKYDVEERNVTMNDLFKAKEVFMTGTTKRILPVVQVDNQMVGTGKPGQVTMGLYEDFLNLERKYSVE